MKALLEDLMLEPRELRRSLLSLTGEGRVGLERAARVVREADHVLVAGIGSSWHAGMAVQSLFHRHRIPACLIDASELLHFSEIADGSALVVLSRSGRSVEIVRLIGKARAAGAPIIAVTNTPESPLAQQADVVLDVNARFDHLISITMYSGLALVGGLLAEACGGNLDQELVAHLQASLAEAEERFAEWQGQIDGNDWFCDGATTYFLSRGPSLASAHEARLLWEEACKCGASASTTGGFRHGPQEIVEQGLRVCLWLHPTVLRSEDETLIRDLGAAGARVMAIGQGIRGIAASPALDLPPITADWQFLVDYMPAQMAAAHFASLRGVDCDSFRFCPYVVEEEGGL